MSIFTPSDALMAARRAWLSGVKPGRWSGANPVDGAALEVEDDDTTTSIGTDMAAVEDCVATFAGGCASPAAKISTLLPGVKSAGVRAVRRFGSSYGGSRRSRLT